MASGADRFYEEAKKLFFIKGLPIKTLEQILSVNNLGCLQRQKFLAYNPNRKRGMIFRIDKCSASSVERFTELTADPTDQDGFVFFWEDYMKAIDVTGLDLRKIAEEMGLNTDYFHWYV
jgi:hypothetical protein